MGLAHRALCGEKLTHGAGPGKKEETSMLRTLILGLCPGLGEPGSPVGSCEVCRAHLVPNTAYGTLRPRPPAPGCSPQHHRVPPSKPDLCAGRELSCALTGSPGPGGREVWGLSGAAGSHTGLVLRAEARMALPCTKSLCCRQSLASIWPTPWS